jgi:hypothetical protein
MENNLLRKYYLFRKPSEKFFSKHSAAAKHKSLILMFQSARISTVLNMQIATELKEN